MVLFKVSGFYCQATGKRDPHKNLNHNTGARMIVISRQSPCTLPLINIEAHKGPYIEDSNLVKGPSPLPCQFEGVYGLFIYLGPLLP